LDGIEVSQNQPITLNETDLLADDFNLCEPSKGALQDLACVQVPLLAGVVSLLIGDALQDRFATRARLSKLPIGLGPIDNFDTLGRPTRLDGPRMELVSLLNPPQLGIVDRAKQRIRKFVLIPASSQTQGHMTLRKASIYAPFVADFLAKLPMAH
jgi:hypothetical protein